MLSHCGAGEDFLECLGLEGDQANQFSKQSTMNIHEKFCFWSWSSKTGHLMWRADSLKKTEMLERLTAKGEEDVRRWEG